MNEKTINCPHCGKILSPDFLAGNKRDSVKCPVCGGYRTYKNGKRYTTAGTIQRYLCKDCAHRFSHL